MEIWKEIKGFENYEVSTLGRIKSLARTIIYKDGRVYKYKSKILKPNINTAGYFYVNLFKNTKSETKMIHQLVAIAFLNHKPNGLKLVVDHVDSDRLNNELYNLQVITTRENTSKGFINCSSKYTGVHWDKACKKWKSNIKINGKNKYLGLFTNELEASKAYQKALLEMVK